MHACMNTRPRGCFLVHGVLIQISGRFAVERHQAAVPSGRGSVFFGTEFEFRGDSRSSEPVKPPLSESDSLNRSVTLKEFPQSTIAHGNEISNAECGGFS